MTCRKYSSVSGGRRWKPPITACTFCTPDATCACLIVLMIPRWLHDVSTTSPLSLSRKLVPISCSKSSGTNVPVFFAAVILFREAAETVDDTDLFLRVAKRLFEPTLRDLAGRERVVGHDRRLLCHHEQQICVKDCLPIERAVLAAIGIDARAKTVFAADEE